ncbi:sensor histidine kinase, partial [Actinoplanes sp. NPDC049596]
MGTRVDVRDAAVAIGMAAVLLVAGLAGTRPATAGELVGCLLLALAGLSLVARRRAPVAALIAAGVCTVGYQAFGFDVFAIAYLVAVYSAVRAGRRLATAVTSVLVLVALPAAATVSGGADEAFTRARGVLELA